MPDPWGKQYLRQYQSANSNSIRRESWAKHLFTSSYPHLGANVKNTVEHLSHPVCPISPILCLYLCVICVSLSLSRFSLTLSLSLSLSVSPSLSLSLFPVLLCLWVGSPIPSKGKAGFENWLATMRKTLGKEPGRKDANKKKEGAAPTTKKRPASSAPAGAPKAKSAKKTKDQLEKDSPPD